MRRRLVPLVPVLVFLSLGLWSAPAGAVVCPQAKTVMTQPCCGPPVGAADATPCCPTPTSSPTCCSTTCCSTTCCSTTCCGTGAQPTCTTEQLTISATPNPSTEGHKVTISGKLTGASSPTTVDLWQKLPGQSSFARVAQASTNGSGVYTFVRGAGAVQTNADWYTTAAGARSLTLVEHMGARVRLLAWSVSGGLLKLTGHVAPGHRGEKVALQQHTSTGWHTIATPVIGRLSNFTVRHHFAHTGAVRLRAVFAGDARNTRSISAPVTIQVK